ncbi:MAG: PLxRFG domain-containing protein, partial [Rhodoferax sp.]
DQALQEYLRLTKANSSAMRRLIHRQGIAGFSEGVGRVLASFVYSNARQTSAGLNVGDMGEAVAAIPKEQGELKDAAVRRSEYIKNPQEEAHAVRGLLFAQYIAARSRRRS